MLEAKCRKCGETFNPADEDDLEHLMSYGDGSEHEQPCGGQGDILGEWVFEAPTCQWFALCDNQATGTLAHPILGEVPICDRCAAKVEAIR